MTSTYSISVPIMPVWSTLGLLLVFLILAFGLFRWARGRSVANGPSRWRSVGRFLLVLLVGPAVIVMGLAVPQFLFGTPLSLVPSNGPALQMVSALPEVEPPTEEPAPDWAQADAPRAEDELVADSGLYATFDEARQQVRQRAMELVTSHWPAGYPAWSQVVIDQYSTQTEHDFGTFKAPMYRVQWLLKWPLVDQVAAQAEAKRAREIEERMVLLLWAIAVIAQLAALLLWFRETAPIEMASFAAEPGVPPAPQAVPGSAPVQGVFGIAAAPAMPGAHAAHQSQWWLVALGALLLIGYFLATRVISEPPPPPKPVVAAEVEVSPQLRPLELPK